MWSVEALEDMSTTMISIAMELDDKLLTVRACRLGTAKASTLARVKKPSVMVFTSFMM
jgi:hypothetical protein